MFRHAYLAPVYSFLLLTAACTGTALTTGATASSCGSPGANLNEHDVGDEPGGVALDFGEVAVAPSGAFVIFKGANELLVGWPGAARVDELSLRAPTKLAFSRQRTVVYVGSALDDRLHAVDVAFDEELWSAPVGAAGKLTTTLVDVARDDSRVLVTTGAHLTILDAQTGAVIKSHDFAQPVVDLQILPGDARALVVTQHTWAADAVTPSTEIEVVALADGAVSSFQVPNCASALAITPDGGRAFLSPTFCNKDPISLLDLAPGKEGWVKNLPGFGPLALGPGGATAVAFLDTQNLDTTLFDDPAQVPPHGPTDPRYHVMTLDTQTLKYDFTAWGDGVPRYLLTPDGRSLLVEAPWGTSSSSQAIPLRIFDTQTHAFRDVKGDAVTLDDFVMTDDSKHIYAVNLSLVDVDVAAGTSSKMNTGFSPLNINTSPDGATLYLRQDASTICIYDVAEETCTGTFTAPPSRVPASAF